MGRAVLSKSVSSRFGLPSLKLRPLTHLRPLPYPQISLPCLLEPSARQLACLGLDSLSRDVRAEELRRPSVARVASVASVGRRENAARVQLDGAHAQVRRSSVDVTASVDDGFQRVHLVPPVVLLWINALLATHLDRPPSRAIVASRIWSTQALTHFPTGPGIDVWSVSARERVRVGFVGGERAGSVPAVDAVGESLFAAKPSRRARIVRQRRTHESKGVWIVGQQLRRQLPYVVSFTRRIARQESPSDNLPMLCSRPKLSRTTFQPSSLRPPHLFPVAGLQPSTAVPPAPAPILSLPLSWTDLPPPTPSSSPTASLPSAGPVKLLPPFDPNASGRPRRSPLAARPAVVRTPERTPPWSASEGVLGRERGQ